MIPGFDLSGPSTSIGRATRYSGEESRELWHFPVGDPKATEAYEWLRWLGSVGLGGFREAKQDAHGLWLIRSPVRSTLSKGMRDAVGPMPWKDALALVIQIAKTLDALEGRQVGFGALTPHEIALEPEGPQDKAGVVKLHIRAEAFVRQIAGDHEARPSEVDPRSQWLAPEVAGGEPVNPNSNRYTLGLVLYRLLSGRPAFDGLGIRLRIEQARRGAAPFSDEISAGLPPGLQSTCLNLLAPEPNDRPGSASALIERLQHFLVDKKATQFAMTALDPSLLASRQVRRRVEREVTHSNPLGPLFGALALAAPVVLGLGLGLGLYLTAGGGGGGGGVSSGVGTSEVPKGVDVPKAEPLTEAELTVDDCARCHPRQSAQWRLSVMGHAAKSPLFQALEILIEEQAGKSRDCPGGAGILRVADPDGKGVCKAGTGLNITGTGGEHWCVNCHTPRENLNAAMPAWDGVSAESKTRLPIRDLMPEETLDGIDCIFCHQVGTHVTGGNEKKGLYEGNPNWTSPVTGITYAMRPEDSQEYFGVANSGYFLEPDEFLAGEGDKGELVPGGAHKRPSKEASKYLRSARFCGSCHDVRLFGTDGLGIKKGEHFRRLRNAYSEWVEWAVAEKQAGRKVPDCNDCHMSMFPGVCVPESEGDGPPEGATALRRACPDGTHFQAVAPGTFPKGRAATSSDKAKVHTHYFSGVDVPLSSLFPDDQVNNDSLDDNGIPLGVHQRRDLLLGVTFRFELGDAKREANKLRIPVEIENLLAGHKVPAGFSQEREFWVHLKVTDKNDKVVYEVGALENDAEDLRDKLFLKINVDDTNVDGAGQPLGVFGADIANGPDHPEWEPELLTGATEYEGHGLINLQNGFLRCVKCIGFIDGKGKCQPGPGQARTRAARFEDAPFDIDTGQCLSNLSEERAMFEVFFPVGALDAERGITKGPDAIIDTRSAISGVPYTYTYVLDTDGFEGPFKAVAKLNFRAFPPFLLQGFIAYEALQAKRGLRPSGPLITEESLERLEVIELNRAEVTIP